MNTQDTEATNQVFYYHGTSVERLPAIAEEGLRPFPPPPPYNCWPEFDYLWEESDEDEVELPPEASEPRVFVDETFERAKSYADNHEDGVVLRIQEGAIDWEEGETDFPYLYARQTIPASLITVWSGAEWEPMADYLARQPAKPGISP